MKENTFDVPAYKFFAWKINDRLKYHSYDDYKFSISKTNNSIIIIPFENIDGLKVQEVQTLLSTSEIVVSASSYYSFNYDKGNVSHNLDNSNWFYFAPDYLNEHINEHREENIDKLLEEFMERDYMSKDEYTKRMYRCFFERYQDGSYEKTKERVKRLEMQSNNK